MANNRELNLGLAGLELEALSLLLHFWAEPDVVKKRGDQLGKKLSMFRSAVITGVGKGKHEKHIPRELVYSEYRTICEALKNLRKKAKKVNPTDYEQWLRIEYVEHEVPYEGQQLTFERPAPLCAENAGAVLKELLNGDKKLSELAHTIVGERLGCGDQKVKDAIEKKKKKRSSLSVAQRLLASAFLDICSMPEHTVRLDMLALLLNTLFWTECSVLVIYYLVQRSHFVVGKRLSVCDHDFEDLEQFCEAVCPNRQPLGYEPFLRLT